MKKNRILASAIAVAVACGLVFTGAAQSQAAGKKLKDIRIAAVVKGLDTHSSSALKKVSKRQRLSTELPLTYKLLLD